MKNKTIMTDLYELTMAQTYFMEGKKDEILYFDIFFRENPFNGGYTMSGGLDEIIHYIQNFNYEDEEIEYLRSLNKFSEEFLTYLKDLTFKGDVYAVPDGTLLACFNHASLVITASKRITKEAKGKPVMEFGARRARGIDSAIEASKNSYIGGCVGTSNTYAGMEYGIPVLGTMAHSLVTETEDEYEAFLGYAKANPDNCLFLVDTYDTLRSGVPNAIKVADNYLKPNGLPFKGIRIDSGDLAYLSKKAREMLDKAGYQEATICLSNGLDEFTIKDLFEQGAEFDSLGVGDNIAAAEERVGGVYKLVAVEERGMISPRMKISGNITKMTTPGFKKVVRFYDKDTGYALGDVVALREEEIPKDEYTLTHPIATWKQTTLHNYTTRELLIPIFENGQLVYQEPTLKEKQAYCEKEYNTLYPEITRIIKPHEYYVDLSDTVRELRNQMIEQHKEKKEG